jgi:predicted AAA+ superfamily ATPase
MLAFEPHALYDGVTYSRNFLDSVLGALADTPVVLIHGARQVGKSTLAKMIVDAGYSARYLSLDDITHGLRGGRR